MLLAAVAVICLTLGAGGLVADHVLPHTPLQRYIDRLPDFDDDAEIAHRYEEAHRKWVARARAKVKSFVRRVFCPEFTNR